MSMQEGGANILQRLNAAQKQVTGYIQRDKVVKTSERGGYSAISHDAVTAHIRQAMLDQGIVPILRLLDGKSELFELPDRHGNVRRLTRYSVKVAIDFLNKDDPQDKCVAYADAMGDDYGDKAPGKALSIAVKYIYLKTFLLETGEDEESRVAPLVLEPTVNTDQASWIRKALKALKASDDSVLHYLKVKYPEVTATAIEEIPAQHFGLLETTLNRRMKEEGAVLDTAANP